MPTFHWGGVLTGQLDLTPPSGEGGQVNLNAATENVKENGIALDNYHGNFRLFGIASADGKTITGSGTTLLINPYSKTITGGYTFDGTAGSANKLNTSAGSATQPVYFSSGKPVACTYTLGKSVPSNAVFTDTNTWRGIQDTLTSDSSTDSLSAKQGKTLNTSINVLGGRSFQKRGEVNGSTDWNTLTDLGCYKVQVADWGDATKYHGPNEYSSSIYAYGLLIVYRAYDGDPENRLEQIFIPHSYTHPIVHRMFNKDGWNKWYTIYSTVSWDDIGSKPTSFTPASHNHNIESLTNFSNRIYDAAVSRTANTILAAPNGSNGVADFRKLVADDLPSHTHAYLPLSGGTITGELLITPATGEGGELRLNAAAANTAENGIVLDNYHGDFRLFGYASADGKTYTHGGTPLWINPYSKTISGGYTMTGALNGNASSASKLTTSAGNATQPVYFSDGKPIACTYTLGKSVPSDAKFTDTNTWRGIQDNLTSDSATDSLSAKQGKALNTTINVVAGRAFQMRGEIGATADWNTLTDPGCYKIQAGATLGDSSKYHGPNEYSSSIYGYGLLFVSRAYDGDVEGRTVQIYFPHNSSQPALHRMKNSTSWQTWHTMYNAVSWNDIGSKPTSFTPASHNHNYIVKASDNGINTANDNTKTWGTQYISAHFYSQKLLTDQPSQYGFVLNLGTGNDVHQIWLTQSSGDMAHRGGNESGWNGSWRTVYDSSNMTAVTNAEIDAMF